MPTKRVQRINKSNENVLICGNGPSLAQIDYTRLPAEYDVFRCNQFYFEDQYFAGKNIKACFFNPSVLVYQYWTVKVLQEREEYKIEHIVASSFGNMIFDRYQAIIDYLVDVIDGYEAFLATNLELNAYLRSAELYRKKRPTSGVYMIMAAIASGYRNIYLAGIDFYQGAMYAFDTEKDNLLNIIPNISDKGGVNENHSKNFDLEIIRFLQENADVSLYSVCPSSELATQIQLSESQVASAETQIEAKPADSIKDMVMPDKEALHCYQAIINPPVDKVWKKDHKNIYQNIYYHLIGDLFRLPYVAFKYIQKKYQK